MKSAEIRSAFLDFFKEQNHEVVKSSSLVPGDDPTLLFTNAGMVQFKDVFLGGDKRSYSRATSSQRCVRAGGKHNDLENVGYTARHHTFFEMLGNFSFGDYFKRDAIKFAWQFLTQTLNIPEEKLWITVHISDDEAADIWIKEMGVSAERFSRLDEDNFWQMGDAGPCGPSSEIFYDHGADVPGGPPGSENDDLDRYIEIWNLVFMQFERQVDGSLVALPKPSVDTGMGLERIAAVMQGVHSNYEIDMFQSLLQAAMEATGSVDSDSKSLRVIADHIRSCSFLVVDGVVPSNEGRGYVLRRIIRRAVRHGHKLGQNKAFFHTLVKALVAQMGDAYPELLSHQQNIEKVLLAEEEQFAKTLDKGMVVFEEKLKDMQGDVISGETAFVLYDTYGFPVDLTNDIARERGFTLDVDGYEVLMDAQKRLSRESGSFKLDYTQTLSLDGVTEFVGHECLEAISHVSALILDNKEVSILPSGNQGAVVLSSTPFYAESGGQAGDSGYLVAENGKFEVHDCIKSGAHFLHIGVMLEGTISVNDSLTAMVDANVRKKTASNHSATHLLHAALRKVLGEHVTQKGSLVNAERFRFDFSHSEVVTKAQWREITHLVNSQIRENSLVDTEICSMDDAIAKGAMALFGEKYGDEVRVLTMGDGFSVELCGGTHVNRTGDIGVFYIVSESGVAAGVRRVEAITGEVALNALLKNEDNMQKIADIIKSSVTGVVEKSEQLISTNKNLEKELQTLKAKLASVSINDWLQEAKEVGGIRILSKIVEGVDAKSLRDTVDQLKNKLGTSAVILASVDDGKIALVAGVSKDATSVIKAGDIVRHVALQIGGKGGGRPDMAQGGGTNVDELPLAMKSVFSIIGG